MAKTERPLHIIDFQNTPAPTELVRWTLPEKVTRECFTPFLVTSFGAGEGVPDAQVMYLRFAGAKTGLDVLATFASFHKADTWNALSEREQRYFLDEFGKVDQHTRHFKEDEYSWKIQGELSGLYGGLKKPITRGLYWTEPDYKAIAEEEMKEELNDVIREFRLHRLANMFDT